MLSLAESLYVYWKRGAGIPEGAPVEEGWRKDTEGGYETMLL